MFKLIKAQFNCHCSLTGKLIRQNEQVYFNDITKTLIDAYEYEQLMGKTVIGDQKTYFTRHSKLNTKTSK